MEASNVSPISIQFVLIGQPTPNEVHVEALARAGYEVRRTVGEYAAVAQMSTQGLPHLVILNVGETGWESAFELCEALHRVSDVPTVWLVPRNEQLLLKALQLHAEDCMYKPADSAEVVIRVRRLLRHFRPMHPSRGPWLQIDEWLAINFMERRAMVGSQQVQLSKTETRLLHVLTRSANKTVSCDFLARRLWSDHSARRSQVRKYVHRLRRKLSSGSRNREYIVTVRGEGYCVPLHS